MRTCSKQKDSKDFKNKRIKLILKTRAETKGENGISLLNREESIIFRKKKKLLVVIKN